MKEIEGKARLQHLVELIKYSPELSDEALEPYMEELLLLSPDPEITDYIFWQDWTVEEIVDKVLSYKAIE